MRVGRCSAGVGAGELECRAGRERWSWRPRGRGGRLRLRVRVWVWWPGVGRGWSNAERNLGDGGAADGGHRGAGVRLDQAAAPPWAHQLLRG